MHVSVEYNPLSYEYYLSPVFVTFPELEKTLLDDFKLYKAKGILPNYFGRDTAYDRPEDIQGSGLFHVYLMIGTDRFANPPKSADLSKQNTIQCYRTSDTALVYAQSLMDEHSYSLIAVFTPPAHNKAQNYERMRILAGYARDFSERID